MFGNGWIIQSDAKMDFKTCWEFFPAGFFLFGCFFGVKGGGDLV